MGPKTFIEIVNHVYPTRNKYAFAGGDEQWDFPDYGGLPKRISNTLSSEAVDAMQDIIQSSYSRKRDFVKAYKERLFELGEPGLYGKKITKSYCPHCSHCKK
jgi:hypothetical protein